MYISTKLLMVKISGIRILFWLTTTKVVSRLIGEKHILRYIHNKSLYIFTITHIAYM